MRKFLLQINFILLALFNFIKDFFPYPIRNFLFFMVGIKIPLSSSVHRKCRIFSFGNIKIGKNSVVNSGCYLDNRRGIIIGNNTAIAHDTKIYTLGHNINSSKLETKGNSVIIEDNCFIFSNVLIMPGVKIEEGAIVLPGAVVTKNVKPYTIVGGNPAHYVNDREKKINYKNNYNYWFAL